MISLRSWKDPSGSTPRGQEKIAKARTFDEICAPSAQAVTTAGIGGEEFDHFFEEVREEVWRDKHGRQP